MNVVSSRNSTLKVSALEAVLGGIAEDGGLFVPEHFYSIDPDRALESAASGYEALSAYVLGIFFDLEPARLLDLTRAAYSTFDTPAIVPIQPLGDGEFVMELTHGPTLAFKDMALQVLPRLTEAALQKKGPGEDILILTATSGDTGKAALEGFKNVERTAIYVFYPQNGVAPMQKLQMVTQDGRNTGVCAVEGNFDDAQTGVKALFADSAFRAQIQQAGYSLSSANSINFGRLAPQVAYYVYAWAYLVNENCLSRNDLLDFCVPTGNFGNILAAYYAKRMGVPVGRLICASNANNVLTDFFTTGEYDANREFYKTMSPSMDILISSNLERLLFELSGRNSEEVAAWMSQLASQGSYRVPEEILGSLKDLIWAAYASEKETAQTIRETYHQFSYLMDPHTAVAQCAFRKYREAAGSRTPVVTVSTANPYKFTSDVYESLTGRYIKDAFEAARELSAYTHTEIPPQIARLSERPVLHDEVVTKDKMGTAVEEFARRLRDE